MVNNLMFSIVAILILVGLTIGVNIAPAFACAAEPPPSAYPQYTLKERVNHVSYVFTGTITDIKYGDTAKAIVYINQYYKGVGPNVVEIRGFSSGADCQETVEINQQAVFFVYDNNGFYVASRLEPSKYVDPTEKITNQFLADLVQAVGHEPMAPIQHDGVVPQPTEKPTVGNGPTGLNLAATGTLIGVVAIIFAIVLLLRR